MAVAHLPERPDLGQLRKQAREFQRAVRDGEPDALADAALDHPDPDFPLARAQSMTARRHGFVSWPRLVRHVEAIRARLWEYCEPATNASPADQFLRLACLNYAADDPTRPSQATTVLSENPTLPSTDLAVAAVVGDVPAVRAALSRNASVATEPTGPYDWSPLMYLAYGRVPTALADTIGAATLLLEAGADVNDGRFFDGLPIPFTVLTGVFGGGENAQPPHPHSTALARLLLERGAEPNDAQTLYNRMFTTADDFLEVLFEFGLGTGDGGPWRRELPDLLPSHTDALRDLLGWALNHDQVDRVELLARHGVDVVSPLGTGRTPIEVAVGNGHTRLAARLAELGAAVPVLDPVEAFVAAVMSGDAAAVAGTPAAVVDAARVARPELVVWAAGHGRVESVELLVESRFDIDALGRSDLPVSEPWQTALHTAVERDDAAMIMRLLELGADASVRDVRFDATPAQWADHLGHDDLAGLFEP
ncbi:ankyrin repeat domain-containing protein [Williamsia phyllosphaerae]|uniref:ankyrin repeat domain-containing protein n=1 Tax=Williamsia phyllosphaerae TaxID=885042 RepID=UPI00166C79A0|nr:ankyrin repeat domain-containing protein [Williamsia phyllosphaerae]